MKYLIILIITVLIIGCGDTPSDNSTTPSSNETPIVSKTIEDSLKGEWMYIVDGTVVYIDDTFEYPITKVNDTLITIEKNDTTYHLMRSGIDTTRVQGNLYSQTDTSIRGLRDGTSSIGNINVVLQHITDEKNKKTLDTESKDFEFTDVKSGDYKITATTDTNLTVEADVDIHGEEVSLGSFKLVSDDGYNFKTEFIIDNSDSGYFYGNLKTYTGKLKIKNIGTKKGSGLNYKFNTDSGYVSEFSNDIVLGTVDVDKAIEIPFSISFDVLDKVKETVSLDIVIKDVNNNEWIDTVFFHVYQTPMDISIKTKEANVKGYIIAPGQELTKIDTSDTTITVPYREGKKYYLVLSNPNIDSETPYSVGVDTTTLSFDTFQETSAHEPNNMETEAFTIKPDENIVSYLHEGDIDYYIIDMSSDTDVGLYSPPSIPFK